MTSPITSVTIFPSSANVLYIGDNWATSISSAPEFYYELRRDVDGTFETLKNGNVSMTTEQWNSWSSAQDDKAYILSCLAKNLNLTLVS